MLQNTLPVITDIHSRWDSEQQPAGLTSSWWRKLVPTASWVSSSSMHRRQRAMRWYSMMYRHMRTPVLVSGSVVYFTTPLLCR